MNRRSFLQTLAAVVVAPLVATAAPAPVADSWRLCKGDVIQIDGIYDVNPFTGQQTGYLKQFVVTEDTTDSWSVAIHPPLSDYVNRVNRTHVRPLFPVWGF